MPAKSGQKMTGTYVDQAMAERFSAWARQSDGGTAGALRRLIISSMEPGLAENLHGASPLRLIVSAIFSTPMPPN